MAAAPASPLGAAPEHLPAFCLLGRQRSAPSLALKQTNVSVSPGLSPAPLSPPWGPWAQPPAHCSPQPRCWLQLSEAPPAQGGGRPLPARSGSG